MTHEETERDIIAALTAGKNDLQTVLATLEQFLPTGYAIQFWEGGQRHTPDGPRWNAFGPPGSGFGRNEPAVRGQGAAILARITMDAIEHATANGYGDMTRAEQRAWNTAHPLPICLECGRVVTAEQSLVSSVPHMHRDCA